MDTVETNKLNISIDDPKYFEMNSEGSIRPAEACSLQSLNKKVKRTGVVSRPMNYHNPPSHTKPVIPEKSTMKSPSIISEIKKSRTRCVSFSAILQEEITDRTVMKEDSDSKCEDNETRLDNPDEEVDDEISTCVSEYTLEMHSLYLNRRRSLESSYIRPPTPPNTSHLLKQLSVVNTEKTIEADAILKEH